MSEEASEAVVSSAANKETSTASQASSSVASVTISEPKLSTETTKEKMKAVSEQAKNAKGGDKTVPKDPQGQFDYSKCKTYEVQEGDTLFDVAQKFVVSIQQLRYFNHLNKLTWKIHKGQTLYIPDKPIYVPAGE